MAYTVQRRPFSLIQIVDPAEILNDAEIRGQILSLQLLHFTTPLDCIKWCARRKLLQNSYSCENCSTLMTFCRNTRSVLDGYQWICKFCKRQRSIRKKSFFENSKLHLHTILILMYGWALEYPQDLISFEARLGNSTHTVITWYSSCRDVCERYFMVNEIEIGGLNEDYSPKTVEIAESKFFHEKYNRKSWLDGHWVLGGIERETMKCFLVEVPDKTEETLAAIIERHILPGSIIVSNGSTPYNNIPNICGGVYDHQIITQEKNSGDSEDDALHTQNVDNMWLRAKRKIKRQFGTSEALFRSYLHDSVWRNQYSKFRVFPEFLVTVASQYPVT